MRDKLLLWFLWLAFVVGLFSIGFYFRNALNTDAVAYLRIAQYYSKGRLDLAISGYWGPLASWVMTPFLNLGLPALLVARGFMAGSAVVFVRGCLALYRAFELPSPWTIAGTILAALASIYWSVQFITPDLLLSGLIALAVACSIKAYKESKTTVLFVSGLCFGLAYLTKAIAFPLALGAIAGFELLALLEDFRPRKWSPRSLIWAGLGFALLAVPWILVLSFKYQTLTFSTTPQISHTLAGPPDIDRYHPFARAFQRPPAGRITSWEEPSRMAYRHWSPFESAAYASHQLKVTRRNLGTSLALLTSLNVAWLGLFFAVPLHLIKNRDWREVTFRFGRALLIPVLLIVAYLPCYFTLTEQRFFYPAFPFLFAALALWGTWKMESGPVFAVPTERIWWCTAIAGALLPVVASIGVIGTSPKIAGEWAADLAQRIRASNSTGPIAGSANLPGGRTGLYVAFLLGEPWCGDEIHPDLQHLKAVRPRLVMAVRGSLFATQVKNDPAFENIDERLFGNPESAASSPVVVYEFRSTTSPGNSSNSVSTGRMGEKLRR